MSESQNKLARNISYPMLIQKGLSEFYYLYLNDIDDPIDCKKEGSDIFKYDLFKRHIVGKKVLAPIMK